MKKLLAFLLSLAALTFVVNSDISAGCTAYKGCGNAGGNEQEIEMVTCGGDSNCSVETVDGVTCVRCDRVLNCCGTEDKPAPGWEN